MLVNFIKNIGWMELVVLAIIIMIFFGTKRLTNLSKSLGTTAKEIKGIKQEINNFKEGVA